MVFNISSINIQACNPKSKLALLLSEKGIQLNPIEADEGNIDRYVISKRVVVDRWTGSAFLKGIMEKTIFTSVIFAKEHFAVPIFILEGQINYKYTMFDPQATRGALTSMMLQYGVNVLQTENLEETAELLIMIARQEQLGIPEITLIPKRNAMDITDMQRRLIEMLPGCGMKMA